MIRRVLTVLFLVFVALSSVARAELPIERYDRVEIATTKTSIYVGSVTMIMPEFTRRDGVYSSTYQARVFPYFFSNEHGRLSIAISDESLRALERGEPVEFHGEATNSDGEPRRLEGRAVPDDAVSGKIKVRVFVSKRIQLIFNTTYRFPNT